MSRSERETGPVEAIARKQREEQTVVFEYIASIGSQCRVRRWGVMWSVLAAFQVRQAVLHTPSIAFRHLPPNSVRFGYATEGVLGLYLYLRAAVHRCCHRPPKGLGSNNYDCGSSLAPKHARKHETHPPRVKKKKKEKEKKEFRLDSNDCCFICAGVTLLAAII